MAFELPTLPNFNVNPPQIQSGLEQYGKMLQLKSLMGQQQLLPGQLQEQQEKVKQSQIQTQQMQLEQQSQQAMMKAWSDPEFLKNFTGTDKAQASGVGFDPDALTSSLISKGVLPKDALGMTQSFIERSQKIAETLKAQGQTAEAQLNIRSKTLDALGNKLGSIKDLPVDKAIAALDAFHLDLVNNPKAYQGLTQQEMGELHSTTLDHLQPIIGHLGLEGVVADAQKKKYEAAKAAQELIPETGGLSPAARQQVQEGIAKDVAVATNPAVQHGKEAVAAAEGTARANTELNKKREETSDTQFQTAIGADERLNRMEKSYTDATKNHNQQAMLALLTDHIGMTLGLQKGARITKDIINEAQQSQPWLAKMEAKFDSDGLLSGVTLSPGQMKQMLDLGYSARENAWQAAGSTAQLYGVKPPPNAAAVYNKRDPNARVYDQSKATKTYQGHTYEQQSDGSWKLKP